MPPRDEIMKFAETDPANVQIISTRPRKAIEIVEYQESWPHDFAIVSSRIRAALGDRAISIDHVGSTSVPGLPAKAVIDVNLVVNNAIDEDAYVPALETAGFQFLHREPKWYQHRFFGLNEPYTNLHVFGLDTAEPARMLIFRDYLREHDDERAAYAKAKRDAAEVSRLGGETGMQYNSRKEQTLREIMQRALKAYGLLD